MSTHTITFYGFYVNVCRIVMSCHVILDYMYDRRDNARGGGGAAKCRMRCTEP